MFLSKRYNPSAISLFLSLDFIFVYFLFYLEMLICYILNSYFVYPNIKLFRFISKFRKKICLFNDKKLFMWNIRVINFKY